MFADNRKGTRCMDVENGIFWPFHEDRNVNCIEWVG